MASYFVHGREFANRLLKAWNITRPVRSIRIDLNCKEAASVTIEFVPEIGDLDDFMAIAERYQLAEREPESWRQREPQL